MMNLIEKLKLFVFYFAVISGTLLLSGGMTTSQAPPTPVIILPDAPTPPAPPPPPAPSPSTPTRLSTDVLFMVRSDSDCIVLASPQGILKATRETGPLRIRARFSDNPDKIETRKFSEKHLWIIEAARTGTVELITWPIGGTEKDVQRRLIEANVGPLPPPIPPTPPTPPEPPPSSALQKSLQAAFDAESDPKKHQATAALAELLGSVVAVAKTSGKITTALDFQTTVRSATNLAIGESAIPKVRQAVGAYLVTVLPTVPSTPTDDAYWAKAATEYEHVSHALKGVK